VEFSGPSANSPVISELVRRFDLLLNILQANVDYIQGLPFGIIIVEAIGGSDAVEQAIRFIQQQNLKAEVLGHVAGDDQSAA
jgi:D-methionine transport system ATP-binding protein